MRDWRQHRGFMKLVGMVVMVPLVAWLFGFRQTVGLWREYTTGQENVEQLHAKDSGKETLMRSDVLSGKQVLNNGVLLEHLSGVAKDNQVTIVKYTPFLTREEGNLQVYTGELVLAGGFISLLKVMDYVERDGNLGKMISTSFQVYRDRVKKERQLRMTLFLQQLTLEKVVEGR